MQEDCLIYGSKSWSANVEHEVNVKENWNEHNQTYGCT